MIIAVTFSVISIDVVTSEDQSSFVAMAQSTIWNLNTSGEVYYNGGNMGIGTTNPSRTFEVHGYNMLTDPNKQYNSHFPWSNDHAYITGKQIHLRGGIPQDGKEIVIVDTVRDHVTINGDLEIARNIVSQGDICIGKC